MNKETKKILAVISITLAVVAIIFLLLSGFDISGIQIHKGLKLN